MLRQDQVEKMTALAMQLREQEMDSGFPKFSSMTYVEGVLAALDWMTEETDDPPLDEDDL